MGGGLPAAAFGGRADVMGELAPAGPVYQAGTLSGNPVAMAAGLATLRACTDEVYATLDARAGEVAGIVSAALTQAGVPHRVNAGRLAVQRVPRRVDAARRPTTPAPGASRRRATRRSSPAMLDAGVYLPPSGFEAWFVSAALDDAALDQIAAAAPAAALAAARVPAEEVAVVRTTVSLVRHGEVHNPEKVLYGRLPAFQLSERGRRQAEVTAKFLRGRDVAAVISSPLERAVQTADPIAEWYGLPVQTDPRLIESSSVFQGRQVEVGPEILKHPYTWKHIANPFRPSWGEAYVTVAARVLAAVEAARDAYRGREVVLVEPTSCRSGRRAGRWRDGGCGTARTVASARSPASRA